MVKCSKCGQKLHKLVNRNNAICDDCRKKRINEYFAEYRKNNRDKFNEYSATRRWLNGGERKDDLGPELYVGLASINGELRVRIK